jgi:hypothetical protein
VLGELQRVFDAELLVPESLVVTAQHRHPFALDDASYDLLDQALQRNRVVVIDDFHIATATMMRCGYPRSSYLQSVLTAIATKIQGQGKKLIVGTNQHLDDCWDDLAFGRSFPRFAPEDYSHLCS